MPVITTNIPALLSNRYLAKNSREMSSSLSKLASGSRIVRASDDAAGLAVSTSLQSDITTLKQAGINAAQASSLLQVADGALARIMDIVIRAKALATASISGSVDSQSRAYLEQEYNEMDNESYDVGIKTQFNGINLIRGLYSQVFQVGTDAATDTINVDLTSINMTGLFLSGSSIATPGLATSISPALDTDIANIAAGRAVLGAYLSRFQYSGDIIDTSVENLTAAKSAISDVDIGAEQSNLVSKQVLTEASIAAVAQANKMPTNLLSLMR